VSKSIYNAAIIGCGNIAGGYDSKVKDSFTWTHAKAYKNNPRFNLMAAFDVDVAKTKRFCEEWQVPNACSSVEELLRHKPEALSICSPNDTHYPLMMKALEQEGLRAIICEKPLALSLKQAEEMQNACTANDIILAVNYFRRWDENLAALGGEIKNKKYGNFLSGRVVYTKGVFHNASHAINLLSSWFGSVAAISVNRKVLLDDGDFLADFSLQFSKGTSIEFRFWDYKNFNFFDIDLMSDQARIHLPMGNSIEIQMKQKSLMVAGEFSLGEIQSREQTVGYAISNLLQNLADVLDGKSKKLKMEIFDAVESVRLCEEIKTQRVNPAFCASS